MDLCCVFHCFFFNCLCLCVFVCVRILLEMENIRTSSPRIDGQIFVTLALRLLFVKNKFIIHL